jgi:hypothetical protein
MRNLEKFIDSENTWKSFFNSPQITFPLSQTQVNDIARSLDSKLSPENLMMDGEAPVQQVIKTRRYLEAVAAELEQYSQRNGLDIPAFYEL